MTDVSTVRRYFRSVIALACASCLLVACASSTVIRSNPSGAKVFLDGALVGKTPYTLSDRKIVGSSTSVRLEYPGREPTSFVVSRSEELQVGALVAGLFLLVPFLWVMGYKSEHTFDLPAQEPGSSEAMRALELQRIESAQ
jgi:hypothetical protein